MIHVGCCGFPMAQAEYFRRFRLLEVQQTFYQPPRIATLEKWRRAAPQGFTFTLKAWQLITHPPGSPTYRRLKQPIPVEYRDRCGYFRPSGEVFAAWQVTLNCARALAAPFILFQCPASFTPTPEHLANLRSFFAAARASAGDLQLGWEPRGDWPRPLVRELCRELGQIHVVDPLRQGLPETTFRYFRLHGLGQGYAYRYSDEELQRLLSLCDENTYCLFNNDHMAEDAARFQCLVDGA